MAAAPPSRAVLLALVALSAPALAAGCLSNEGTDTAPVRVDDEHDAPPPTPEALVLFMEEVRHRRQGYQILTVAPHASDSIGGATCEAFTEDAGCLMGRFTWRNGSASIAPLSPARAIVHVSSQHPGPMRLEVRLVADRVPIGGGETSFLFVGAFFPLVTRERIEVPLTLDAPLGPGQTLTATLTAHGSAWPSMGQGGPDWGSWLQFDEAVVHARGDVMGFHGGEP